MKPHNLTGETLRQLGLFRMPIGPCNPHTIQALQSKFPLLTVEPQCLAGHDPISIQGVYSITYKISDRDVLDQFLNDPHPITL